MESTRQLRVLAVWVSCLLSLATLTECQKPNLVLLFADDLGYGDLGCYGHPTSYTPNIDQLATEGLRFTDFYVSSPVCSPSRAALMTGRYQTRSGIYPGVLFPDDVGGLPHNETTIAEYLKGAGYSTGMVGKWHLGVGANGEYLPTNHGFDQYLGIPYSNDMGPPLNSVCFYPNTTCNPKEVQYTGLPVFSNATIAQQPADFMDLHSMYTNSAVNFIKSQAAASKPFFLYFAFNHVHKPQYASKQFTGSTIRGNFGDALTEMDDAVGQVMAALKQAGVDDNTFVFFTADNGPALWEMTDGGNPGLLKCGKATTYEGGQREPAIAWWPGKIAPGVTRELSSSLDVLPTFLKVVDQKPKEGVILDGYDMSSILFNKGKGLRKSFVYYASSPSENKGMNALRYENFKAHFYTAGSINPHIPYSDPDCWSNHTLTKHDPPLLFDLHTDPSEVYTVPPSDPRYKNAMDSIMKAKSAFEATMVWGESQMKRGRKPDLEPCATPGCAPFPQCCKT